MYVYIMFYRSKSNFYECLQLQGNGSHGKKEVDVMYVPMCISLKWICETKMMPGKIVCDSWREGNHFSSFKILYVKRKAEVISDVVSLNDIHTQGFMPNFKTILAEAKSNENFVFAILASL